MQEVYFLKLQNEKNFLKVFYLYSIKEAYGVLKKFKRQNGLILVDFNLLIFCMTN